MAKSTIKQDLVFPVSGDAIFTLYNPDGTLDFTDPAKNYSTKNQVVESFTLGVTPNTEPLNSGNSNYPRKKYTTTLDGKVAIKLNAYDPQLYAMLTGSSFSKNASDKLMWTTKQYQIPIESPYEIELPAGADASTVTVKDGYGNGFTRAESAPEEGQFSIATESGTVTLTFSADDKGGLVDIIYAVKKSGVMAMELDKQFSIPSLNVRIYGEAKDVDETQRLQTNYVFDKLCVDGELKPPDLTRNPTGGWTINLTMLEPRGIAKPFAQYFSPIEDETPAGGGSGNDET